MAKEATRVTPPEANPNISPRALPTSVRPLNNTDDSYGDDAQGSTIVPGRRPVPTGLQGIRGKSTPFAAQMAAEDWRGAAAQNMA